MPRYDDRIAERLFSLSKDELATIIEFIGIADPPGEAGKMSPEAPFRRRGGSGEDSETDAD